VLDVLLRHRLPPLLGEALGSSTGLWRVTGGHHVGDEAPLPYEHVDQDLSRQAYVSRASDSRADASFNGLEAAPVNAFGYGEQVRRTAV
jgi:hypothetical protein